MFTKYFTVLAASAAVAFAYTAPTTQCTDKCNPIAHPGLNEPVPKGTTYNIEWNPTTDGTVTILLYTGPAENLVLIGPVAEKIANDGKYEWEVPSSLKSMTTHYGIQLINDADGTFQYSTQFGISGEDTASASSSSSSSSSAAASSSSSAASSISSAAAASSSSSEISEVTAVATTSTVTGVVASTGMPTNGTILTASITKPSTLETTAARTGAPSSTTSPVAANDAGALKMSLGGAVVALMAAVAVL